MSGVQGTSRWMAQVKPREWTHPVPAFLRPPSPWRIARRPPALEKVDFAPPTNPNANPFRKHPHGHARKSHVACRLGVP